MLSRAASYILAIDRIHLNRVFLIFEQVLPLMDDWLSNRLDFLICVAVTTK